MGEIRLFYNHHLFSENEENKNNFYLLWAKRIARIFENSDRNLQEIDKNHWQLGSSNDWYLRIDAITHELIIWSRNFSQDSEKLEILRQAVIILLGLTKFNSKK